MEPHRRPAGRRALLPAEADLCNHVGLTEEEYWQYLAEVESFVHKRNEHYGHIPDIRADPVSLIVTLVIGLALQAVGALLAPKPKAAQEDERRPDLDVASERGRTRYTPSSNFDSVQSLANLGEVIPLIFADYRKGSALGGVRVNTDMLWSQMLSTGGGQQFNTLLLYSQGQVVGRPDYDGIAIGALLVKDYAPSRSRVFFSQGQKQNNRLTQANVYDTGGLDKSGDVGDPFSVFWPQDRSYRQHFSGCRTPATKNQFGAFSPLANGHGYKVPWELVLVIDGSGKESKDAARKKRAKIKATFYSLCGLTKGDGTAVGNRLTYEVNPTRIDLKPSEFKPHGLGDVDAAQNERRITADDNLQEGQQMLLDQAVCTVVKRPERVWAPELDKKSKYQLEVDIPGRVELAGGLTDDNGDAYPWDRAPVQQCAIAVISNNRKCHATEIGIKSEVWRQMTGAPNFNGHPGDDTVEDYEKDGANINLGTVSKYIKRLSFFRVEARPQQTRADITDDSWLDITGNIPFCVRGTTPVAMYNTIHILHPDADTNQSEPSAHEYRFIPVGGYQIIEAIKTKGTKTVRMLDGTPLQRNTEYGYNRSNYWVWYTGHLKDLTAFDASNTEWICNPSKQMLEATGPVGSLEPTQTATAIPLVKAFKQDADRFSDTSYVQQNTDGTYYYFWEGKSLRVTPTNRGNIDAVVDDQEYNFKVGDEVTPYEPEGWFEPKSSPDYDGNGRENGVLYDQPSGLYLYYWGGELVASSSDPFSNNWLPDQTGQEREVKRGDQRNGAEKIYDERRNNDIDFYSNGSLEYGVTEDPNSGVRYIYRQGQIVNPLGTYRDTWDDNVNDWRYKVGSLHTQGRTAQWEQVDKDYKQKDDKGGVARRMYSGVVVYNNGSGLVEFFRNGNIIKSQGGGDTTWSDGTTRWKADKGDKKEQIKGHDTYPIIKQRLRAAEPNIYRLSHGKLVYKPSTWEIRKRKFGDGKLGYLRILRRFESEVPAPPDYEGLANIVGADGAGGTVTLKRWNNGAAEWVIRDDGDDYVQGKKAEIIQGSTKVADVTIAAIKSSQGEFAHMPDTDETYFPFNAACDYFWNSTESSSHLNGPEHQLTFVNEIVRQGVGSQYERLSMQGLKLLNSREWTSFSDVSGWFKQGIQVTKPDGSTGATNLLPEIAYALLTDERLGAGSLIGKAAVDADAMANAARWCEANGFYWDGVISNRVNLREFIFEQAGFCLLDFCIKGGQFALQPSFPQAGNGGLDKNAQVTISGLFTDGNMKDLEVTFLSPEEQQGFVAVVIYRMESVNGFPENRTINVRLNGTTDVLPVEKFDMTQFCTSRAHALQFAKVALKIRELQDHGVKFKTTPQAAMGLEPGQYVKMVSQATHTDRWRNGSVDDQGRVNSAQVMTNFGGNVAYWTRNTEQIKEGFMRTDADGVVQSPEFYGCVFSVFEDNEESRIYKIESLSYDDNGFVEVAASHSPLTERGTLAVLDWSDSDFEVDG